MLVTSLKRNSGYLLYGDKFPKKSKFNLVHKILFLFGRLWDWFFKTIQETLTLTGIKIMFEQKVVL